MFRTKITLAAAAVAFTAIGLAPVLLRPDAPQTAPASPQPAERTDSGASAYIDQLTDAMTSLPQWQPTNLVELITGEPQAPSTSEVATAAADIAAVYAGAEDGPGFDCRTMGNRITAQWVADETSRVALMRVELTGPRNPAAKKNRQYGSYVAFRNEIAYVRDGDQRASQLPSDVVTTVNAYLAYNPAGESTS